MKNLNENELKLHKYMSLMICQSIEPSKKKFEKVIQKKYAQIQEIEQKIVLSEDISQMNELSLKYEAINKKFINEFAVYCAVDSLYQKNIERKLFIESRLKDLGIYNDNLEKEQKNIYSKVLKEQINKEDVVNDYSTANEYYIYFDGVLFFIKNGKLNFSYEYNLLQLQKNTDIAIKLMFLEFPEAIVSVDASELLNIQLKQKLLMGIANYVCDQIDKLTIIEINKKLGNILNLSYGVPDNIKTYLLEIKNYFNVKIVNFLCSNSPENADFIKKTLVCDEKSKYLY